MRKPSKPPYSPQAHELQVLRAFAKEVKRYVPPWEPPCIIERPIEKCEHGVLFGAENNHAYCGFADYSCAPFDPAEYRRWIEIVKEHQLIEERLKHHCGTCEEVIPVHLAFCKDCALNALTAVLAAEPYEVFNTTGRTARFYDLKASPLSDRSVVDFGTVQVFARTILCDVLSEVMRRQVNALAEIVGVDDPHDKLFRVFGEESPFTVRMLKRFYLWTKGETVENIASVEGTTRQAVERYINRWTEVIEGVLSPLGSPDKPRA